MQREEITEFVTIGDIEYEVHYEQYYTLEKMDPDVPYSYEKEVHDIQIISVFDEYGEEQNLSEVELELIKEKL